VAIGGAFFGESMFHTQTNASKVALAALVQQMKQQSFELLDIQFMTSHLAKFGAIDISRDDYLHRLGRAITRERNFIAPGQQTILFQ
jgi:leucyl/phenylalanyl-tRNA--protein transferase